VKPLVRFAEALAADATTRDRYGLSDDMLMEAAAIGMAARIESDESLAAAMDSASVPAAAICGRGNNGGDALAVLRRLAFSGRNGLVAIVQDNPGHATSRRLDEAGLAGVTILSPEDGDKARLAVSSAGLVLDGLSGVGFRGPRRQENSGLAALVDHARGPVIAIDVPSGTGPLADPGSDPQPPVAATRTLCIEPLKAELFYPGYRRFSGVVVPVGGVFHHSAGSSSTISLLDKGDLGSFLPGIDQDYHKGHRGALCVFAGAVGSTGAAALCARAGSASGAGSVTLLVRDAIVPVLSGLLVSQMVRPVSSPGTRRFQAVVAGPGWGEDEANARILEELWNAALPLVLDADALGLLAADRKSGRCSPLVLTPHPGEFAPLAAVAAGSDPHDQGALELARRRAAFDTAAIVSETAERFRAVVVLKGAVTWIGDPDGRLAVWDGREPAMATAGSGDVLAGLAGGFLARGAPAWDAAVAAVIVHGLAGRAAGSCAAGFYEAEALLGPAARLSYGRGIDGNA
jgi:NAD(P)H-hydrate epimerase